MQSDLTASTLAVKFRGLIRLTRWKETLPFTIPVTVLGSLLAFKAANVGPDWRLPVVALANILVVLYAFMINDVEDAPDDAREAARAARNPISCGELTRREGWAASTLVGLLALALFALSGLWTLLIGAMTLALSYFYSWRFIRLKAWPVADVVSHSLMLSGLLFLAGYFAYDAAPGPVWLVAAAMTLISVYGQLYNQVRDFDMDIAAGLHNTAIIVGKRNTQILMYLAIFSAAAMLITAYVIGVIPLWVPLIALVVVPFFFFFRVRIDMRGGKAADISGNVQIQALIVANAIVGVWLVAVLLGLA